MVPRIFPGFPPSSRVCSFFASYPRTSNVRIVQEHRPSRYSLELNLCSGRHIAVLDHDQGILSRSTGGDIVNSRARYGIARVLRLASTYRDSRTEIESIELDHVTAGYTSRVTCRCALICMGNQVVPISYTPSITECFALGDVSPLLGRPFPRHSIATMYIRFPSSYDLISRLFR